MDLLEKLTQTPGISGREHRVRDLILREIKGLFDDVRTDPMGSLICHKRAPAGKGKSRRKPLKVMLAAHMDQIGFMVRYIDDKGFARVNAVGGFDPRNLFARLCTVCPDPRDPKQDLVGVLNPGSKPIHIASEADRTKVPPVEEFAIDLGMPAEEVKKRVKIGDMVVLKGPFANVGETVVSQCMDNRVACWIAIRAMQQLKKHSCDIYCVFTTQEEVGLRRAQTAAYAIQPDIGVAIDTTLCVDTPGVPDEAHVTRQGDGAALTVMDGTSIGDLDLIEAFEKAATKAKIPFHRSVLPRGGTIRGMQRAASGCRTMTLSCATRYIHTVTEMVHTRDLFACRDLLAAYLATA